MVVLNVIDIFLTYQGLVNASTYRKISVNVGFKVCVCV